MLAEHIPVPLVDLTRFETKALMQLLNLFLRPLRIFLEFIHEYLILSCILSEALLNLLGSLDPVADDYARDGVLSSFRMLLALLFFDKGPVDAGN